MKLQLRSAAFSDGGTIPVRYSGQGDDLSPPLSWTGTSGDVQSYVLIVEDPDAPLITFTHWVLFNLPATSNGLPEGVPPAETLTNGARQGKNSFLQVGYRGPKPPTRKPHRYFFKLYALDTRLELQPRARKKKVLEAMQGHIVDQTELIGIYQKKK